ncbi:MAG: hypothetical protein U0794_03950 [Isosphaeraceae bacterium]
MGETEEDRIGLLHTLASLPEPPESVPVNALVAVAGTPLEGRPKVDVFEMLRMIATARLLFPRAMVRLSAGRIDMTEAEQALCFLAGANSIFAGDRLLTTPNPGPDKDQLLFEFLVSRLVPRRSDSRSAHGTPSSVRVAGRGRVHGRSRSGPPTRSRSRDQP